MTQLPPPPPKTQSDIAPLTRDLLTWIASTPRTYAEAMEAWRTNCPRFPIWEDAIADGLIAVHSTGSGQRDAIIKLTPRGRDLLTNGQ